MQRIAGEVRLWTREQVTELMREALAVLEEVGPPNELREQAFVQTVGLLAQKNVQLEQMPIGVPAMHVPRG